MIIRRYQATDTLSTAVTTNLGTTECVGTTNIFDGSWHHVVSTLASVNVTMYVDGRLDKTCSFSMGTGFATGADFNLTFLNGGAGITQLDDWAIWHEELTGPEVAAIYARQSPNIGLFTSRIMDAFQTGFSWTKLSWITPLPFTKALPDSLSGVAQNETSAAYGSLVGSSETLGDNDLMTSIEGLWHLDEQNLGSAGHDFIDTSGGNHWGASNGTITRGFEGIFNKGINLNGTDAYVHVDPGLNLLGAHTVSAWIKPERCVDYQIVVESQYSNNQGNSQYNLFLDSNCKVTSYLSAMCTGNTSLPQNLWSHVTATYESGTLQLYVNGKLDRTCTQTKSAGGTSFTHIGASTSSQNQFKGNIDEVAIWSRALKGKEIAQLYRRGANRVYFQVRTCTADDCSDDPSGTRWKGPDGSGFTAFTEINNNTVPLDGSGLQKTSSPSCRFRIFQL